MLKSALLICILSLGLLSGCGTAISDPVVGGPCKFKEFSGSCTIIAVNETNMSRTVSTTIHFTFRPAEPFDLTGTFLNGSENRVIADTHLESASYLGLPCLDDLHKYPLLRQDVEACGVTTGAVLPCKLLVEIGGTCTPLAFSFK